MTNHVYLRHRCQWCGAVVSVCAEITATEDKLWLNFHTAQTDEALLRHYRWNPDIHPTD